MSDDADKKQISIDPTMFEFSSKSTRRQKQPPREKIPKLKLRSPISPNRIDHTLKSHALKFLRNKQLQLHQSRLNAPESNSNTNTPIAYPNDTDSFSSNFDSSLEYLSSIQQKHSPSPANRTFRSPLHIQPTTNSSQSSIFDAAKPAFSSPYKNQLPTVPYTDETNIKVEEDDIFSSAKPFDYIPPPPKKNDSTPKYGCLKGGTLPTYRQMNRTMRNTEPMNFVPIDQPPTYKEWLRKNTEMRKVQERREKIDINATEKKKTPKYLKRKRTVRRTYHLGRSQHQPKVSVLVSNRTIRRDIDKKCNELRQAPIEEVRKTLIKKGMIKVGTLAPNEILRKMYESLGTICGDVKNHNADNLVYNYFNDTT